MFYYISLVPVGYWWLALVFAIFAVAGAWKMFEKAGIAGWKAIIPVYNIYLTYKLCWDTTYFWVWLGLTIVSALFESVAYYPTGFGYIAGIVIGFVSLLIQANASLRLSVAFGHGILYGLGLYFFPYIFTMILGFGSSTYVYGRIAHSHKYVI